MPSVRLLATLTLMAGLTIGCQSLPSPTPGASLSPTPLADESEGDGFLYGALVYIPNRLLDVFDIVRARVRLGPGLAVGARATELADVFVGSYASVYIGLPGPRGRVMPRLPAGLESKSGIEVSAADATLEAGLGPDYGDTEFGFGFQLAIVGVDIGVDPGEILDLVLGLVTIDIADDDF
jgi:hypothetical protein